METAGKALPLKLLTINPGSLTILEATHLNKEVVMSGMSLSRKLCTIFVLLTVILSPVTGKEDYRTENQPIAIEKAIHLSYQGVLKQKENGFVYLDVSNEWITTIVPHLELQGELRQRPTAAKSIGAHISVFDESENISPQELGSSFQFELKEVRSFTLHTRDGLKKLWVIAVVAPELEQLRENYGCTPKWKGHEFHITLGKQMPKPHEGWQSIEVISDHCFSGPTTLGLATDGDFNPVHAPESLATISKVDAVGQLVLKKDGYVYVNVDNQFIDKISEHLPTEGRFDPLATTGKAMGAHISVFYEDEIIGNEIWDLAEVGQWFTFDVKEVGHISKKTPDGEKKLWMLAVDAPGLERLRSSYGLKPKLLGHDFHITLGYETSDQEQPAAAKAA